MAEIVQLPPHERMTPDECLAYCARELLGLSSVIILGINGDDELVTVASADITNRDAVWLFMAGIDWARGL
jgi:hypothetical protein